MLKIKSIYTCFIIIIFYGCDNVVDILSKNNKESENDLYAYNLHGKVKEVKAIRFNTERLFGEIEKTDTLSIDIRIFNRKGFATESSYESFKTSEYDHYWYNMWKYKYSDNIKSIKIYDEDGKLKSHTISDSNGDNITKVYRLSQGDTILLYDDIYNKEGQIIETNRYDDEDNEYLNYKTKRKYNSKGELINRSEYNREGKLKKKMTIKRDNKGNAIESQRDSYDDYDEISESYLYIREYDELNNEIYVKQISDRPEYRSEDLRRDTSEYFTSYNYEEDNWINKQTKHVWRNYRKVITSSVHITERTIIYY